MPALIGTGTTITFATSGFAADVTEYALSRISRTAVRTTHFSTPQAGANQFGGETWMPTKLVDPGFLTLGVAFNPQRPPPIMGPPEAVILTFPFLPGHRSQAQLRIPAAFVTDWRIGIPLEGKMTANLELKLSGLVRQVPGLGLSCLIAYWKLDEAMHTPRRDSYIHGLDLVELGEVPQAAGQIATAAAFTTAKEHGLIRLGADAAPLSRGNASFTITAWVYMTALVTSILVSKGTPLPSTDTMEYQLAFDGLNGRFQFLVGNGVDSRVTHGPPADVGAWHFVVGRHDALADTIRLDMDGTVNTPGTAAWAGGSYMSGLDFAIGKYGGYAGGYSSAIIDEVGFWDCALTDPEVDYLYNGGIGRPFPFTI